MTHFARCRVCGNIFADAQAIMRCGYCIRDWVLEAAEAPTGAPVAPPERPLKRSLPWTVFDRRFRPLMRQDGSLLWEPWEVPQDADARYWWTVLDPMTSGTLYLGAGFHFVNRLGYVRCENPWAGEWEQHPEYVY